MKLVASKAPFGFTVDRWQLLKWSLMTCAIFWTLVFQLGEKTRSLVEFVYVNF